MLKLILRLVPANTVAALIAEYVTRALQKIRDKDRAQRIGAAVSSTGDAVRIAADAVTDCEITEDEVDKVGDAIQAAVRKIIEAAK